MFRAPTTWHNALPQFRRMMVFIDGENLVKRFEKQVADGQTPRSDNFTHVKGSLVWHPSFVFGNGTYEIIRVTYYTSVIGSDEAVEKLQDEIKNLSFGRHANSTLPNRVTPKVFKRNKGTERSKGVDISLTVEALNQVHSNNVDTVMLLTGDGDFQPLVEEIKRCGKQLFLGAFSSGLSPQLKLSADEFYVLDGTTFVVS